MMSDPPTIFRCTPLQCQLERRFHKEKDSKKQWLNQPPIEFLLCIDSPIRNDYNNSSSSSQVGNGGNQIQVGMDDYLWDMTTMEAMLLDAIQNDELGDDVHNIDTLFES